MQFTSITIPVSYTHLDVYKRQGPTSSINPVVDRLNSKDDTRSYDVMANIYLQYSPVKEIILKTTFSPIYTKTHRGTSVSYTHLDVYKRQL